MTLAKRWVARCDAPGCTALEILPSGDKWDVGQSLNDRDWDAGPGKEETFCPTHFPRREPESFSELTKRALGMFVDDE